jgi:hypothetical protein
MLRATPRLALLPFCRLPFAHLDVGGLGRGCAGGLRRLLRPLLRLLPLLLLLLHPPGT